MNKTGAYNQMQTRNHRREYGYDMCGYLCVENGEETQTIRIRCMVAEIKHILPPNA